MSRFWRKHLGPAAVLLALVLVLSGCGGAKADLKLPAGEGQVDAAAAAEQVLASLAARQERQHDNYAIYYTPEEYKELFRSVTGSYSGIGIYIYSLGGDLDRTIYSVMKNGPAYKAGLLPGDKFLQMNGEDLTGLDTTELTDKITSFPKGTELEFVIERPEVGEMTVKVTTDVVDIPTLDWLILDNNENENAENVKLGLIKIASFNMTTGDQFEAAYNDLISQGMQGLILDLRNNGGGEITAAMQVCDYFVPKGEPLMYIYSADSSYHYSAMTPAVDMPLVVLQNGLSASASEILIGAIQDNGAGTTIGETSFGKGIVQDLRQLSSGAGLRFTSSKYATSHNNDIHGCGIDPDIDFPMPEETDPLASYTMDPAEDPQLAKAVEVLLAKMGTAGQEE